MGQAVCPNTNESQGSKRFGCHGSRWKMRNQKIGDELLETEHVAQGFERWVGPVGFSRSRAFGSFVSSSHSPMDVNTLIKVGLVQAHDARH